MKIPQYIPLFFQFTKGDDAIQAAVRLLPFICIFIFFVMVSGVLLTFYGRYQVVYIPAGALLIVGGALMHTVTMSTSTSAIYGYEAIIAVGTGLSMQVAYSVAVSKVKEHEVASVIGFINVAQIGSVAITLSIAGSIYQNVGYSKLKSAMAAYDFSPAEIRNALGGASSNILQGGDKQVTLLALGAITSTVSKIYILIIAAGGLLFVSSLFMKREKPKLEAVAGG